MVCAVDVCLCGMQELRTEILPRINSAVANIHSQLDGQSITHCYCWCYWCCSCCSYHCL